MPVMELTHVSFQIQNRRPELRLVISSATIEAKSISNFFSYRLANHFSPLFTEHVLFVLSSATICLYGVFFFQFFIYQISVRKIHLQHIVNFTMHMLIIMKKVFDGKLLSGRICSLPGVILVLSSFGSSKLKTSLSPHILPCLVQVPHMFFNTAVAGNILRKSGRK